MEWVEAIVKKRLHTVDELVGIGYEESDAVQIYNQRLEREVTRLGNLCRRIRRLREQGINESSIAEVVERALTKWD